MVNFPERFADAIISSMMITPVAVAGGALCGYIYAKLADLPADQVAKAWAVWTVAETALNTMIEKCIPNPTVKPLIKATIYIGSTMIGIQELQKRGLIGEKMVIGIVTFQAFNVLGLILEAAHAEASPNK